MRESRESKWMGAPASPPVIVLGAGFAGLRAVRRLGRAGVDALWVDARNYHCFLPLLYQVATAGLEPQDIAYPARSILRRLPVVDFQLARVVGAEAGALAEFRRHVVPCDYRAFEASAMRIVLVEAGPELLPPFPPVLRARARRDLEAFGVEVRTGTRVSRITPVGVELAGGAHIPTHTA